MYMVIYPLSLASYLFITLKHNTIRIYYFLIVLSQRIVTYTALILFSRYGILTDILRYKT